MKFSLFYFTNRIKDCYSLAFNDYLTRHQVRTYFFKKAFFLRVQYIPIQEQICVEPGDIMRVHYETVTGIGEIGITPYADSRKPLCFGLTSLSTIAIRAGLDDSSLSVDSVHYLSAHASVYRTPALVLFLDS